MNQETKAKIEAAGEEYTSSSYFSLEYSIGGKTAKECEQSFTSGATYGYNLAVDEHKEINRRLANHNADQAERITTLEARVEKANEVVGELAEELQLRAEANNEVTLGGGNKDSSKNDNVTVVAGILGRARTYLQNKGG